MIAVWQFLSSLVGASSKKKFFLRIAVITVLFGSLSLAFLFISHDFFHLTSSNSVIYVLRGSSGGIELTRDLLTEDSKRLIYMLDANCVFNYLMRGFATALNRPLLELTWDGGLGRGVVKQFRVDGTILEVTFSRFREDGRIPQGLFIGGELPLGDPMRDETHNSSGMGYFDGRKWSHIWCAANEAVLFPKNDKMLLPMHWGYLGSRTIKESHDEVILESDHEGEMEGVKILMKRRAYFRASDDYVTLKVTFTNPNPFPMVFSYIYGDEPWVGQYGASFGDIGWYEGGLIRKETAIDPSRYKYVGIWDIGNEAAGEGHDYTGYADFIQWITPTPSYVFVSNDFRCCEDRPLESVYKRAVSVVWRDEHLTPGESITHVFAVGKADSRDGHPRAPDVRPPE